MRRLFMQAIKYKWMANNGNLEPFLFTHESNKIERTSLLNTDISLSIGEKHCIGYIAKGKHIECPENRIMKGDWNCNECKLRDDFFMCIKCDGSECINAKQRGGCMENLYFVYLAAFHDILKVGISYQFRLLERLIEQGADFGAKIASIKDGKDVRVIEQKIMSDLNIVDRLRGEQKQKLLFGNPNKCIENITSSVKTLKNNSVGKHMIPIEIYDLRNYYRLENVLCEPKKINIENNTKLGGKIVAAKGNILVGKNNEGFFSFNAHELIGRTFNYN
jgi:hypothetical protein